jgi:hypothetical protein
MVVALAGRRIDAENSVEKRFPLSNRKSVEEKLLSFFKTHHVTKLICSGANGSDLIAMKVSTELNIEREMILPFDAGTFRKLSVSDRPGDWIGFFNKCYEDLNKKNCVKILSFNPADESAFDKTSLAILDEAENVGGKQTNGKAVIHAVVVWD